MLLFLLCAALLLFLGSSHAAEWHNRRLLEQASYNNLLSAAQRCDRGWAEAVGTAGQRASRGSEGGVGEGAAMSNVHHPQLPEQL